MMMISPLKLVCGFISRVLNVTRRHRRFFPGANVLMTACSFCKSTGLTKCSINPASLLFTTSLGSPKPLKAMAGNVGSRCRSSLQQLQTAPVGQAEIGDEEIKLLALAQFDGALRIARGANRVASRFQETLHALAGIGVIFHQQDVPWRPRTGLPGFRPCFPRK